MGFAHTEDDALLYSSTCTCTLVHTYMYHIEHVICNFFKKLAKTNRLYIIHFIIPGI